MATISFYFDEMMSRVAADQLNEQSVQVVLAIDVDMEAKDDDDHLAYATGHEHMLVTFDRPFAGRAAKNTEHKGVICLSGRQNDIGYIVRTLREFAENHTAEDVAGVVFWL